MSWKKIGFGVVVKKSKISLDQSIRFRYIARCDNILREGCAQGIKEAVVSMKTVIRS